jgi:hypothetical protein
LCSCVRAVQHQAVAVLLRPGFTASFTVWQHVLW